MTTGAKKCELLRGTRVMGYAKCDEFVLPETSENR